MLLQRIKCYIQPTKQLWKARTPEQMQMALKAGANIHARNEYGETILMERIRIYETYIKLETLKLFVDAGLDVNAVNYDGENSLMYARRYCSTDVLEWLIDAGADVNATNRYGENIFRQNMDYHDLMTARKLIKAEAIITAKDLIIAAKKGSTDMVEIILDSGVYVDATDKDGYTALYWAAKYGHERTMNLLIKRGATPIPELKKLLNRGILKSLGVDETNINQIGPDGKTIIERTDLTEAQRLALLDAGALTSTRIKDEKAHFDEIYYHNSPLGYPDLPRPDTFDEDYYKQRPFSRYANECEEYKKRWIKLPWQTQR